MTVDLELSVLVPAREGLGFIASFAITDQLVVAAGGTTTDGPSIVASSNARHFERRPPPREHGLRDALAVGDDVWVCGEYGLLAVSRDGGASWTVHETRTDACLFGLASTSDGTTWVCGERGFLGRVTARGVERVDLETTARLQAVYVVQESVVALGEDGNVYRWRDGDTIRLATGADGPLTALHVTRSGSWIVVGDGGFIARSPDGAWFSRVRIDAGADLEAIGACAAGELVCVGDHGTVLVSRDDGRAWHRLSTPLEAHLWSVERFGAGVLIGGDDGLIAKLAPPGDDTWRDRINVFGQARPLDAAFAAGPVRFIESGLTTYLGAIGDLRPIAARTPEFESVYGMPMPRSAATFFTRVAAPRVDAAPVDNVFEQLVVRDQDDDVTGLVEAFCGVFCIGSLGNGDTVHMELYEWDGRRQVLQFDHETRVFSGVVADSLDSFVYRAALVRAHELGKVSDETFAVAVRTLDDKVAPLFDAKRRDTEFFFFRSRWIHALLHGEIHEIPKLFNADFNQVVPHDQLPARFEACEKFVPTALYAMWRAYLFDEPELGRYLDIAHRHAARLLRDAARLIDELRAGRNVLGAIKDVRAHLDAFRALDLDPRRADARQAEAEARERRDATRLQEVEAELARTPVTRWAELAWRWLADGVAHRALLARLDTRPELHAQIVALDELRDLPDDERVLAIERLAQELSPELEAVLVGSLVRDDALDGVLATPWLEEETPVLVGEDDEPDDDEDETDDDEIDDTAPGWDAIDAAIAPLYHDAEPHGHYTTVVPYLAGGKDPLQGISVYLRDEPVPHFHFISYGLTELFQKESENLDESGFGFELTLRLARAADDRDTPAWALALLQTLARYVFQTGNRFDVGHKMSLGGAVPAVVFAADPELGPIESEHGAARFLQVVGITEDEYKLIQEWSSAAFLEVLASKIPLLVTDPARRSLLADTALAADIARRVAAEGSSEEMTFAGDMVFEVAAGGTLRIELGALYAAALPRAMRGRLAHHVPYTFRGTTTELLLLAGEMPEYTLAGPALHLQLAPGNIAEIQRRLAEPVAGTYRLETWPQLEIVVTPTIIRDADGRAVDVRGAASPEDAERILHDDHHAHGHEHEHDDDEDDDHHHDDTTEEPPPDADQVLAALAMTSRALRLVPDDDDTQYTHAMLLIDAERAGLPDHMETLLAAVPGYTESNRRAIAERLDTLPVGRPVMHHAAARAFASIGDYEHALAHVRLAVEHGYTDELRDDPNLGELLDSADFKALFR